jgi:hypothetical protein
MLCMKRFKTKGNFIFYFLFFWGGFLLVASSECLLYFKFLSLSFQRRNTCDELVIKCKDEAERCQLDKVEHLNTVCCDLMQSMDASMAQLFKGIEQCLSEMLKFEGVHINYYFKMTFFFLLFHYYYFYYFAWCFFPSLFSVSF